MMRAARMLEVNGKRERVRAEQSVRVEGFEL